jgi:hypothetical protein
LPTDLNPFTVSSEIRLFKSYTADMSALCWIPLLCTATKKTKTVCWKVLAIESCYFYVPYLKTRNAYLSPVFIHVSACLANLFCFLFVFPGVLFYTYVLCLWSAAISREFIKSFSKNLHSAIL